MKDQAILLDLGNTLLEYGLHGQWREFLRRRLEEVCELVSAGAGGKRVASSVFAEQAFEVMSGERTRELRHRGMSRHFGDMLREAMRVLDMECDDEHLGKVMEEFYQPIRESTRPYPDTLETLDRLKANGFRMAIISNTPWDTPGRLTHGDVERWSIGGYFEVALYSGDLPWRKPNPAFMWEAARRLGVHRGSCVVVGDDLASDIRGANAAGMRSVWVDRDRATGPEPWAAAEPDAIAGSLAEARRHVERLAGL